MKKIQINHLKIAEESNSCSWLKAVWGFVWSRVWMSQFIKLRSTCRFINHKFKSKYYKFKTRPLPTFTAISIVIQQMNKIVHVHWMLHLNPFSNHKRWPQWVPRSCLELWVALRKWNCFDQENATVKMIRTLKYKKYQIAIRYCTNVSNKLQVLTSFTGLNWLRREKATKLAILLRMSGAVYRKYLWNSLRMNAMARLLLLYKSEETFSKSSEWAHCGCRKRCRTIM